MRLAVLIINIGGVEDYWKYPAFLFRMFTDPYILPVPAPLRFLIASLISVFRVPFVLPKYIRIGGSPIVYQSKKQAEALKERLIPYFDEVDVFCAMLYSEPLFSKVASKIKGYDRLVVIPMYPQYSMTTTGAVEHRVKSLFDRFLLVKELYRHPLFVKLWKEAVFPHLDGEHIIFVAHSIPERWVRRGDPYREQVYESARLIAEALGVSEYSVAFQSRMGPVRWVGPELSEVMRDLRRKGVDKVVVVPVSFLNEHLETIYELDVEYKREAEKLGFGVYKRVPVPWDSPVLSELLAEKVREVVAC